MTLGLSYAVPDKILHIFKNLRHGSLLHDVEQDTDVEEDDVEESVADVTAANVAAANVAAANVAAANVAAANFAAANVAAAKPNSNPVPSRAMSTLTLHSDEESNYADATSQLGNSNPYHSTPKFAMNFRDIEDSVRCFDGSSNLSVESWVQEFEEVAVIMSWDDFQKYVFAKKSLKGLARLFIMGEKGIATWKKLKDALIDEFGHKVSSAQIHKALTERKINKNETLHEYFYAMKELASQGHIEDQDLRQYIIDGVNDVSTNKAMLYGAHDWSQFKQKLQDYETFRSKYGNQPNSERNFRRSTQDKSKKTTEQLSSCFNCGSKGHKSAECPHKAKGMKCFKCGNFGHISKSYQKKENSGIRLLNEEKNPAVKNIKIDENLIPCLIDTGSVVNVLKAETHTKLKMPKLTACDNVFTGFGSQNNKIKPSGYFYANVEIDGEIFNLSFFVVPDNSLDVAAVIGYPLCQQAEITFNANGVQKTHEFSIMNIAIDDQDEMEISICEAASNENKQAVRNLVHNYKTNKTMSTNVNMKIILNDETPISSRPRRLPYADRKNVEEQIEKWLKEDIIEVSDSEFCSPVVNKKNGQKRLCIDYRRLNKVIVKDRYPTPLIEDQLDQLSNAKVFSSIDLKDGFFHVGVEESSRKYTAFITHSGVYQFRKVPFGLTNSPAVFQRHINVVFRDLIKKGIALPYMDDIIIPAQDEEEAIAYLKEIFELCSVYGLEINF